MNKKKKILIYSPPFSGHLNILKSLVIKYKKTYEFRIIITGWKNISPDISNIKKITKIIARSELKETDPCIWTFPRTNELLDDCLKETKKYKPDLIIYDFFSLEGYFAGKILNINSCCSIPAMIGPNTQNAYLEKKLSLVSNKKAIQKIKEKYGINIKKEKIEMISDGLHIGAEINLIWSYPSLSPQNFMFGRKNKKYFFVGNLRANKTIKKKNNKKPIIYFSLGTVIMNNLWEQQGNTRQQLSKFIQEMTKLWNNKKYKIKFVTQGKQISDKYPGNWEIVDYADQIKELKKADIFITHGGSNSFHEAVKLNTPMIAIPFFGDQIMIGKQIEKLRIGINLIKNNNIDTKKSKKFLNNALVKKLNKSVEKIIKDKTYQKNIKNLELKSVPFTTVIKKFK